MTHTSHGFLSTALSNIEFYNKQIQSLTDLPESGKTLKMQLESSLKKALKAISIMQTEVQAIVIIAQESCERIQKDGVTIDNLSSLFFELGRAIAQTQILGLENVLGHSSHAVTALGDEFLSFFTDSDHTVATFLPKLDKQFHQIHETKELLAKDWKAYKETLRFATPPKQEFQQIKEHEQHLNQQEQTYSNLKKQLFQLKTIEGATLNIGEDFSEIGQKASSVRGILIKLENFQPNQDPKTFQSTLNFLQNQVHLLKLYVS